MVRSFYHRLINTILLLVAIILGVIFVAQNNHLESLKLEERTTSETKELAVDKSGGNPAAAALWADSVDGGLLVKDPEAWLPDDHANGGTLKLIMSSDPKGFNYLILV